MGVLCGRLMAAGEDNRASAVAASRLHFTRLGPQMAPDGYAVADPNEVQIDNETET